MNLYDQILEIARRQAEAARAGDLDLAVALLEERGRLVAATQEPPTTQAEEATIRQILELDRDIATAIRYRMLAIRDEVLANRHGQHALAGYTSRTQQPSIFDLDA